jgi:hypothetical protein
MDQATKQQVVDRLKEAKNVLVTVSTDPSVDQLAACIGLALFLNKVDKRGTAVFSGKVPSTLEFLKPESTLEKTTDSLRDFIISLDKSKADKLRYKVEDQVVKIFITPYRTNLSDKDLDFSQGDFNIDVVLALGVHKREELDQAITAHGRILHDATVISVNNKQQGDLGSINWVDLGSSSLCEMMIELADALGQDGIDGQIATALLTGIVAETKRFSNEKTTPRTMTLASQLMSSGANQQLIATKLEPAKPEPDNSMKPLPKTDETPDKAPPKKSGDGSLTIEHEDTKSTDEPTDKELQESKEGKPAESAEPIEPADQPTELPKPIVNDEPKIEDNKDNTKETENPEPFNEPSNMILSPPSMGGRLTANSIPEQLQPDPSNDVLGLPGGAPNSSPILKRAKQPAPPPAFNPALAEAEEAIAAAPETPEVKEITEKPPEPVSLESPDKKDVTPKLADEKVETLEDAREAVADAINSTDVGEKLEPIEALGAQPINLDLHPDNITPPVNVPPMPPQPPLVPLAPAAASSPQPLTMPPQPMQPPMPVFTPAMPTPSVNPSVMPLPAPNPVPNVPTSNNPATDTMTMPTPPPVPPPMMPPPGQPFPNNGPPPPAPPK